MEHRLTMVALLMALSCLAAGPCNDRNEGGGGGDAESRCEEQFEPAAVCEEDEGECTFYVHLNGSSCEAYCAQHGGQCLGAAWNEPGPDPCVVEAATTCDDVASDQICTCTM